MKNLNRRHFLGSVALGMTGLMNSNTALGKLAVSNKSMNFRAGANRPNVILCMCDDLGWGDVGYNGHPELKTPNLDDMSKSGIRFDRFYAAAPVCSPTRGSAITGRHPYRYGIPFANIGKMKDQEITLAEALKIQGYTTGHFGKWHIGTLTTAMTDANRGRAGNTADYSPPQDNGFDVCYSTESKVPTWNPMYREGTTTFYGTRYWKEDGSYVPINSEELQGDDSRVIMDPALDFIQDAVSKDKPFFTVIWFHTPHLPIVAGPEYKAMYSHLPNGSGSTDYRDYYGCITAMDDQMGRLREKLKDLGIADNTMLWFTSDNGPENNTPGSSGPFRARKRSLYEGGVRVPGLLEWPAKVKKGRVVKDFPCNTSDYFPTVMDALGFKMKGQPEPIDGVSLIPLIEGKITQRPMPMGFESQSQVSLTDNKYKIYSKDSGATFELYDLLADPYETNNIAGANPAIVDSMKATLQAWRNSCTASNSGADY